MRAPGMFLSQPPTATRPSMCSPLTTVSIASAITSRDTREYFMPSVPMEMASLTVGVPNICGIVPAPLSAASARAASAPRPRLQGVMLLWPLATPTMGLAKSPSRKPTARSMERFGARSTPSVTVRLRRSAMGGLPKGPHHTRPPAACRRAAELSLVVDLDDPLLAAARHRDHHAEADRDH